MLHDNFPGQRRRRLIVAEDRAFDLAAVNAFLDNNLVVIAKSIQQSCGELRALTHLADADGRTEIRRLHK